jgi:hypothetical protein
VMGCQFGPQPVARPPPAPSGPVDDPVDKCSPSVSSGGVAGAVGWEEWRVGVAWLQVVCLPGVAVDWPSSADPAVGGVGSDGCCSFAVVAAVVRPGWSGVCALCTDACGARRAACLGREGSAVKAWSFEGGHHVAPTVVRSARLSSRLCDTSIQPIPHSSPSSECGRGRSAGAISP